MEGVVTGREDAKMLQESRGKKTVSDVTMFY
jgi:hypothetical protein